MKMPTTDYTDWADYTEIPISESVESDRISVIRGEDLFSLGKAGFVFYAAAIARMKPLSTR